MKKLLILLFIVALLVGCAPVTEGTVRVVRVIDGDTIEIAGGEHIRYIGIDTPETYPNAEPFGPEVKTKNIELVEGKLVTLERDVNDRDKYGRLLRYIYVDGLFVNGELVRLGYAEAIAYPPDTRYQWQLELLEAEAKAAKRGMWGDQKGFAF